MNQIGRAAIVIEEDLTCGDCEVQHRFHSSGHVGHRLVLRQDIHTEFDGLNV